MNNTSGHLRDSRPPKWGFRIVALWLVLLCGAASPAQGAGQNGAPNATLAGFIPKGWCPERSVQGHLNRDTVEDIAVVLVECGTPHTQAANKRALLVMLGERGNRRWRPLEMLPELLPCRSCLGPLGTDAKGGIVILIEARRLHLSWLRGSRESVEVTLELGVNDKATGMVLLRDDVERVDRVDGKSSRRVRDFVKGVEVKNGASAPLSSVAVPAANLRWNDY